jgi:CRISPR system Cascade subunit CasE
MAAFPQARVSNQARDEFEVLFRLEVEQSTGKFLVIVQSLQQPDWSKLPADFLDKHDIRTNPDVRSLDPLLKSLKQNDIVRFKFRANPVKRRLDRENKDRLNHKRVGIYKEQSQLQWLQEKFANQCGCEVLNSSGTKDISNLLILENQRIIGFRPTEFTSEGVPSDVNLQEPSTTESPVRQNQSPKRKLSFFAVVFEGRLQITNIDKFKEALIKGIGHGKAYGFGLLSIAPLKPTGH